MTSPKLRLISTLLLGLNSMICLADGDAQLALPDAGSAGVFDPSYVVGPQGRHWLLYSSVEQLADPKERAVSLALASRKPGDSGWTAHPQPASVIEESETSRWQAEVGSLAYDPAAENWKLFYHRYLHANGERRFEHGWIAYKSADTPTELRQAAEQRWLTGKAYAGSTQAALGPGDLAPLKDCLAMSEPGVFATADRITLALNCPRARWFRGIQTAVFVLSCPQPCEVEDPGAWTVVSPALTPNLTDRDDTGYSAPAILSADPESVELLATPTSSKPFDQAYKGCLHMRLTRGTGWQVVNRTFSTNSVFNGACSPLPDGGVLISNLHWGTPPTFEIRRLGNSPPTHQ